MWFRQQLVEKIQLWLVCQQEMAWDDARQSKFIESVLLGLPIPYIFVGDIRDDENDLGRLENIDGSQRIRTLARFVNNELKLSGLKKLTKIFKCI
jgi:uncharacterized protein with ParB-like and HNH nuclease domain